MAGVPETVNLTCWIRLGLLWSCTSLASKPLNEKLLICALYMRAINLPEM
jgi:hypothetical protein